MAGTQNQIPYDQIPDAVMYILNRNGRTVEELEEEHGSRYLAAPPPKRPQKHGRLAPQKTA